MIKGVWLGVAMVAFLASNEAHACMLPEVNFKAGSAQVSAEGQNEVASIIKLARSAPNAKITLIATTDYSPPNRRMAERRVNVIRAALVEGGIQASRISVGYVRSRGEYARTVAMEIGSVPKC